MGTSAPATGGKTREISPRWAESPVPILVCYGAGNQVRRCKGEGKCLFLVLTHCKAGRLWYNFHKMTFLRRCAAWLQLLRREGENTCGDGERYCAFRQV